jgi:Tfp pilus assembly protein PilE
MVMKQSKVAASSAFSLVELMVIITIVGLLAFVAIPSYNEYLKRTKVAKVISKLTALQTTLTENYSLTGQWPTSVNSANAGTAIADTSMSIVTNFYYNNNSGNKAWYGYQLNDDLGNGWVFMVLLYNAGVFETHCGALTTGCTAGQYGSCDSTKYYPVGCDETNLATLTT